MIDPKLGVRIPKGTGLGKRLALLCLSGVLLAACTSASADLRSEVRGEAASQEKTEQERWPAKHNSAFAQWRDELRREALAKGISSQTFDEAFAGIAPISRVIELDRRQPEFTLTFWRYYNNAISEERVRRGRELLQEHRDLLEWVEARYGVQPHYLVAFWGLETNYGDTFGSFPVIGALATLAFDARRSDFFRQELLTALRILEAGDIEAGRMEGSWAGAMGHLQFMPSTFVAYAVDADGDGRRDIWSSYPDVFASAGNFLSQVGWRAGENWGQEVLLPSNFDHSLASIETSPENWKTMREWASLGIRAASGYPLPTSDQPAALILPAGYRGPAFLVHRNYEVILRWNRSIFYAIAVGHLADRLLGAGPLTAQPPQEEQRLSNDQVRELQSLLIKLGYDTGGIDGRLGPKTRAAIREFQRSRGLPQDAFADPFVLGQLRNSVRQ